MEFRIIRAINYGIHDKDSQTHSVLTLAILIFILDKSTELRYHFRVKQAHRETMLFLWLLALPHAVTATDYHVGPGEDHKTIGAVPWQNLAAGDRVFIHWREQPYREKWTINGIGTTQSPILVSGIPGPDGQRPVIDGRNAVTAPKPQSWGGERALIKIGGTEARADNIPSHLIIENLEIRSARPPYRFFDEKGREKAYTNHAASIFVEKAENLIIRNCELHDSGNGLFIAAEDGRTKNILIEYNYLHSNGNAGRIYEHNAYSAAIDITYQYNRFGPLRETAGGNNLKDRSAGLTVRFNWIDGGNRLLDLVDGEDSRKIVGHPRYNETFVYGNVLIKRNGGNNQVIHYGGDSGRVAEYRKGTLHLYDNTLVSLRSGNTTLLRLSSNDERADIHHNILFVSGKGSRLALLEKSGQVHLSHNWLKPTWQATRHWNFNGRIDDDGTSITAADPGFTDLATFNFQLTEKSSAIDKTSGRLLGAVGYACSDQGVTKIPDVPCAREQH